MTSLSSILYPGKINRFPLPTVHMVVFPACTPDKATDFSFIFLARFNRIKTFLCLCLIENYKVSMSITVRYY